MAGRGYILGACFTRIFFFSVSRLTISHFAGSARQWEDGEVDAFVYFFFFFFFAMGLKLGE